jgi:hypothetical protein
VLPKFSYQSVDLTKFWSATYTLIHSFLVKQSHTKVAQALQKAVKDIGVLKDDIDAQGPQLNDIIRLWKASQNFPA